MTHRNWKLKLVVILMSSLFLSSGALAEPTEGGEAGPSPELGSDLAIRLAIPLFDPAFAEVPVAKVGDIPIRLGEITPALEPNEKILFWEFRTEPEELTEQFKQAVQSRIDKENGESGQVVIYSDAKVDDDQNLFVEAPLFSGLFADVPVALINEVPLTVAEFSKDLQSAHSRGSSDGPASGAMAKKQELVDRLVRVRLIEQEARNIGFDQTDYFRKQLADFKEKTLLYALLNREVANLEPDFEAIDEMYREISLEGKFRSLRFTILDDAKAFLAAYNDGRDFGTLVDSAVKKGKAVEEEQLQEYIMFKDLLPKVATAASQMDIGEVSQVFRKEDGYMLFKLVDRRFVEDEQALQHAKKTVWDRQAAERGAVYINELIDEYAEINEVALNDLDFAAIKKSNPEITLGEALQPLLEDERVLARIEDGEPETVTVADVAGKIKETYFHGVDTDLKPEEVDRKKDDVIQDKLFRIAGILEAGKLGLDTAPGYLFEVAEFERQQLFDIFMQKVVTPDVRPSEADIRAYYDENLDEYMNPAMFKLRSLPFYKQADAENAAKKLRQGSDFKWVSANVDGLVDFQDKDLLQFDNRILSLNALPDSIRDQAIEAERGDALIYSEPNNFHYVLYLLDVFPAEARPYDQVRKEIINVVYQQAVKETLDDWVEKLKDAYEVRVFLAGRS